MADVREPVDHARTGRRVAALLVLVAVGGLAATVLARTRWWLPPLASKQGADVDRLIYTTLVVTGIVFVLVHLLLATFVWRSAARDGGRAEYFPEHRTLELTYTLVPAAVLVTLIAMGAVVWSRVHSPAPRDALAVEVRAEQFSWLARYPGPDEVFGRVRPDLISRENRMGLDPGDPAAADDIVSPGPELHLVLDRPVRVRLRSKDVIHSLFIPAFRVKQDAVPGMVTEVWFTPTRAGTYEMACAELCGVGHYIMRGTVIVESPQAFEAWLDEQAKGQAR